MGASRRTLIAGAVAMLGIAAAALSAGPTEPPPALQQLEVAREEGAKLQDRSRKLRRGIEAISENFGPAAGLSDASGEIRQLTLAQQRSLRRVDGLLADQVDSVDGTAAIVAEIRSLTARVAGASARQAETLRQNIETLKRLREIARRTRAVSTYFARQAAYGARLAEDSARSFGL